ncbi:MAG: tyrosine-type recombinase/integrase [Terriglobia bacterium]
MPTPIITIFVRHSADCPHAGDEFYKRCACWKHLRWSYGGHQYRKATKQQTWAGAERAKREVELAYEKDGKPVQSAGPVSMEQAIATFARDKAGQGLSASVLKKYRRELGRFQRFCEARGRYALADVALPDLTDFRSGWEQEYPSSRTRQKVQERLRGFFRYALNAGFIRHNPAAALSAVKVDVAPTLPLDAKQYRAVLGAVPRLFVDSVKAARVHALIRCMRYTALAIGDAVCLERANIRYDAKKRITRVVTSRAKTGVDVSVPIPADVAAELLKVANGNPRYVFWQTGNGQPESAVKNWHKDLRALFDAAGMPSGHPHQLRDTAAVEWLKAGVPLEEVSRLLGHASIKTTERHYNPWVSSRQDRLDELVISTWKR